MDAQAYLNPGEQIIEEVTVREDPYALLTSGNPGTLACTENRLVYAHGSNVVDISINRVDSFEYREPKMPRAYLYSGIGLLLTSLLLLPSYGEAIYIWLIVSIVLLLVGYWLRTSKLVVHTPSSEHEFKSRDNDLVEIAHALRDREMGR